ncbi:hypothetical protein I552_9964 [Mycobacterium xenopi 3993]|nr:hypothetical protein I552_9964 [Mycobacterium xenopi 3993]
MTQPPPRPWWRRKGVVISAAALLAVAVTVGLVTMRHPRQESPNPTKRHCLSPA